ncbi:hypothetical protein AgCh_036104 [Apium graveolens]
MEEQKKYLEGSESKVEKIDDDEDAEEEVDKFISLIEKFREARNRRINELNKLATAAAAAAAAAAATNNMSKRRKILNRNQEYSGWIPKFEIQDFSISQLSAAAPASKCNGKGRIDIKQGSPQENDGDCCELDLRLAL